MAVASSSENAVDRLGAEAPVHGNKVEPGDGTGAHGALVGIRRSRNGRLLGRQELDVASENKGGNTLVIEEVVAREREGSRATESQRRIFGERVGERSTKS